MLVVDEGEEDTTDGNDPVLRGIKVRVYIVKTKNVVGLTALTVRRSITVAMNNGERRTPGNENNDGFRPPVSFPWRTTRTPREVTASTKNMPYNALSTQVNASATSRTERVMMSG